MQIYFDFSGYSDMAIGLGLIFGVRLPINFNSPYKSANIVDFWRRWHITLSFFLRDYLYIPLGGNRHGSLARYRNLMVTMLLGGLWHGANWTFVIWGGLHGLMICLVHAWQALPLPRMRGLDRVSTVAARVLTFLAVVLAWVPFRADTFDAAWRIWKVMFGFEGVPLPAQIASLIGAQGAGMFANGLLGRGEFWLLNALGLHDTTLQAVVAVIALVVLAMSCPNTQEIARYDADPGVPLVTRTSPRLLTRFPALTGTIAGLMFAICVLSFNRIAPPSSSISTSDNSWASQHDFSGQWP
jgi:hypothetical protein